MATQPLTIHIRDNNAATLVCPACGLVRQIAVAKFRNDRHTLAIRCRCGHVYSVLLDFRRHFRKPTSLAGTYVSRDPAGPGGGVIRILNISRSGVGFIRHLPADLLKAFESTLEELFEADLLLHVIDVANPAWRQQVAVVEGLLAELGLEEIPCLKVFNKIDRLDTDQRAQLPLDEGVGISALDAATLTPLLVRAQAMLTASMGRDGQTPIDWRRDEGTGEEG